MARLILIIVINVFLFGFLFSFIHNVRVMNEKKPAKPKEEKYNSEYWWYNAPHYYVLSNGEKINLPEYFTWDEYKNISKERFIQKITYIERMLEKKEHTEETGEQNYIE